MKETRAEKQRKASKARRDRFKSLGLVKKEVWVLPEHDQGLRIIESYFRVDSFDVNMMKNELIANYN